MQHSRRGAVGPSLGVAVTSAWLVCACIGRAADPPPFLEGYTDPMSVSAGEEVSFHVSTNAEQYSLEIARVGATDEVVWAKEGLPGEEHPVGDDSGRPAHGAMYGCDWPAALRLRVPREWKSGYYRVVLRDKTGDYGAGAPEGFNPIRFTGRPIRYVMFFAVRSARPGRDAAILVQLSSNTYHAYNNWGGSCLYSGPGFPRVSFNRPIHAAPWASPYTWEIPLIRWAERAGYKIDVCCNLDLESRPQMLRRYRLVLSVGHDEYWSAGMRDNLEAFIADGGNVAFFSGNTCCWQVRVEDDGRALVCYKRAHEQDPVFGTPEQHRLTTLWSDPLLKRPENRLTGVGFTYGGYNGFFGAYESGPGEGEYTVHRPEHWIFAGTGLKRGEKFGKQASIAGYESDGCEYVLEHGLPVPTGRDGTPKNLQILATAPGRWAGGDSSIEWAKELRKALPPGDRAPENFVDRDGGAVLGVYTRGGTVVTAGSCDWSHGLQARDPVVERITGNILDRLSQ